MNDSARAQPFRRVDPSKELSYDELLYPAFNDEGNLKFYPADGSNVEIIDVEIGSHYFSKFTSGLNLAHSVNSIEPEKRDGELYDCLLAVTDARLILMSSVSRWSDDRNISHVWYPWISDVSYRPKQGFLLDPTVNVSYRQDFPLAERGTWWHRIEYGFKKDFDSSRLARNIVSRIARHHLHYGVHDTARDDFSGLVEPEELPLPGKGSTASYYLPAFVPFPGGVPHVASGTDIPWSWNGPNIADLEAGGANRHEQSDAPIFEPAESPTSTTICESGEQNLGQLIENPDEEDLPADTLSLSDRRIVRAQLAVARGLHRLRKYEEAAEIHEEILDVVEWNGRQLFPHRFEEVVMRLVQEHVMLDDPDSSLAMFEKALASDGVGVDEDLELLIREKLCDLLESRRELPVYAQNLRRMGELCEAWCTREEQIRIRIRLAITLRGEQRYEEALEEYEKLAMLYRSVNLPSSERAALLWGSHMLSRLNRQSEAEERWYRARKLEVESGRKNEVEHLEPPMGPQGRAAG